MSKTAMYAATLTVLAATALVGHYLTGLDWPWAIVAGAAVSLAVRAVSDRRRPRHPLNL
jgi:hypothetical protein